MTDQKRPGPTTIPKTFTPIGEGLSVNRILQQEDEKRRQQIFKQIKQEGFFHGDNWEAYMLPAMVWHLPNNVRHLVAEELGISSKYVFVDGFEITAQLPDKPGKHFPVLLDLDRRGLKVVLDRNQEMYC